MANLAAYIIRRLILLIFVLLGVTALCFAVSMMFSPADRAMLYVRNPRLLTESNIDALILKFGLDQPFYVQYGNWLSEVLQGNLGWSRSDTQTVTTALTNRWPYTFQIVVFAAPLIIFIGIYLGVQSSIHRNGPIDHFSRIVSIVGWSLPSFWVGLILLSVFYNWLGWFPPGSLSSGMQSLVHSSDFVRYTRVDILDGLLNLKPEVTIDALRHIILPVTVIVTIDIALLIRVMRSSMLEALSKPYVITARAKGLKNNVVIYKHARRNALIPVATLSGMLVAGLLGGLVITETVFGIGGLGGFAARAAMQIDMPAVLGYAILSALLFVIANLIVDILYAYIDPRIRLD
jgi:peptide/nickel transport system permease protein